MSGCLSEGFQLCILMDARGKSVTAKLAVSVKKRHLFENPTVV